MKILICSDGKPAADSATRLGASLAGPLHAETTLLGIAERAKDETALREALEKQAEWLRAKNVSPQLAAAVGASVTLLHVMAEPPAIYADLVRLEEDVTRLLESNSELGINLRTQKQDLEKLGVPTEVHVRHGIVVDQVFAEVRKSNYD